MAAWRSEGQEHTRQVILRARTIRGGWTRAQLAEWGVPWPPPGGWKERLERSAALAHVPLGPGGQSFFTTEAYRRKHKTGEFSEWMTPAQRAIAAEAYRRMVP